MKIHEMKNRLIRITSICDAEEKITITEDIATKTIQNYPKNWKQSPNRMHTQTEPQWTLEPY